MHQPPPDFNRGGRSKAFMGLKFSIPGIFWVGKFGKCFFGRLVLSRDFWGYSKQSGDSWYTVLAYPGCVVILRNIIVETKDVLGCLECC